MRHFHSRSPDRAENLLARLWATQGADLPAVCGRFHRNGYVFNTFQHI